MKKLYAIQHTIATGTLLGPMPWSVIQSGVEIVNYELGVSSEYAMLRIVVRCEDSIGKEMGWTPFERPEATG